jgi:hypothetical protein
LDLLSDSDLHSNLSTMLNIWALPHDSRTMDQPSVLPHEVTAPPPRQSTEDIQTMKRRPMATFRPVADPGNKLGGAYLIIFHP